MGQNQRSLIYAFVSRGTLILAEYTKFSGNFNSIALQCLQKLPATNNKFTYNCDNHTFNYLVDNGYSNFAAILKAMHSFSAESEKELSFSKGDFIVVRKVIPSGWSEGECNGRAGWFPSAYVEKRQRIPSTNLAGEVY